MKAAPSAANRGAIVGYGLPIESPFVFYPKYLGEIVVKAWRYWSVYRRAKGDT